MNIEEAIKQLKKHKAEIDKEYISARYSKAIETLLTAYENLKSYNKGTKEALRVAEDLEHQANKEAGDLEARCFELETELEKEKEKNKELVEQNKDIKSLFNIQASIAKELDFNTNEKMVKFKDEYYVPDTMAINANIGEPKTIELRYISATKYLTKFDEEE